MNVSLRVDTAPGRNTHLKWDSADPKFVPWQILFVAPQICAKNREDSIRYGHICTDDVSGSSLLVFAQVRPHSFIVGGANFADLTPVPIDEHGIEPVADRARCAR